MKTKNGIYVALIAGSLLVSFGARADFFGLGAKTEIQKAHDAYLSGDIQAFVTQIKKAWLEEGRDEEAQKNLLGLMSKAQDKARNRMASDWKIPEGLHGFSVSVRRTLDEDENLVRYRVQMNGMLDPGLNITQLKLTHFNSDPVLDRNANIGKFYGDDDKYDWFSFQGSHSVKTPELGLYLITIQLSNNTSTEGWFVLTQDLISTESPQFKVPAIGQVFSTVNPTFSWKDFKSPQYQPNERRRVVVKIDSVDTDTEHFDYEPEDATPTEVAVVKGKDVEEYIEMIPGSYQAQVIYREARYFGDLRIRRDSAVRVPFKVK